MQKPIKISRSGLKLFLECPRCFWLDLHHKIKRPPSYPYTLASAVDYLVKQEFDKYREKGKLPSIFVAQKIKAKLYAGEDLATWRNNFKGISFADEDLNASLYGAVDDILEFSDGSLAVVDYKSTGSREITVYDDYRKQMDTYAYILERMGHKVHPEAYFVFYQVDKTGGGFKNSLPFTEEIRAVTIDSSWVPKAFEKAITLARQKTAPSSAPECVHCAYVSTAAAHDGVEQHDTHSDQDYVLVDEE